MTETDIFNLALTKVGEGRLRISAVDGSDPSHLGYLAKLLYPITRDEEVRSYKWAFATKRATINQAQVTTSASWVLGSTTVTVGSSVGILPGWVIATSLIQGGGTPSVPYGIPWGTTVLSVTDPTHISLSSPATATGSATIIFQVNNLTGYWFSYVAPSDVLRGGDVYAVFPNYTFLWPYKVQNIVEFGFIYESGYIYTNLDPSQGNPVVAYVFDPGVSKYPPDFCEALSLRLAWKLCTEMGKPNLAALQQEYQLIIARARGNSNIEHTEDEMGNTWWTERGR